MAAALRYDRLATSIILILGVLIIIYALVLIPKSVSATSILFLLFGVFSILQGVTEYHLFPSKLKPGKLH